MHPVTPLRCACGQVRLETTGQPITSAECHCNSCRAAASRLQALPHAARFQSVNGGTHFVLYRKDRIRFVQGANLLRTFRLGEAAKTRRVLAGCCNTPVFMELENGHWLSLYGCLWSPDTLPPLRLRTMTADLADRSVLDDAVPNKARQSLRFYAQLLGAWVAMGFRAPKIPA